MIRKAAVISVVIALMALILYLQLGFEGLVRAKIDRLKLIPSGRELRVIFAGYRCAAADLIWAWTVVSFGSHFKTDKDYSWLPNALRAVTTLDPLFRDVYLYGGIMLAMEGGMPKEAVELLERGVENLPDDWQLHFFLGFYRLFFEIDPLEGVKHLERAASLPGHPPYLPVLVAKAYTKLGRLELAIRYLEQVREMIDDPELKNRIESQLAELLKGGSTS